MLSNSEVFVTSAHKENLIVAKNDKKTPDIKNVTEKCLSKEKSAKYFKYFKTT